MQPDNLVRKFYYHVSAQAEPSGGRPLIMFFHGDGGNGSQNLSALHSVVDPDGAVVVQPEGPNNISSLGRGSTAWSFFQNASKPDDVLFAKTVMDGVLAGTYLPGVNINPKKIYAIGESRGGFFVYVLLSDVRTAGYWASIGSMFGSYYCETGDAVCAARSNGSLTYLDYRAPGFHTTVPILHIHGDADTAVGPPARIPSPATGSIQPWGIQQFSQANSCSASFANVASPSPAATIGSTTGYLYKPSGCAIDYRMILLPGVGHGFSGYQSYTWTYFKLHPKP
jgi:poly(3-hydroxybutyrate) depolymerase